MPNEPDPEKKRSAEEMLWDMMPAAEAAMDSVALNQCVYEAVEKELGRITREFYPGMNTYWQAEQFRALADKISRHAMNFCIEISDIDHAAEKSQG